MTETSPDRSLFFRVILIAAVVASMLGAVLMVLLGVKKPSWPTVSFRRTQPRL